MKSLKFIIPGLVIASGVYLAADYFSPHWGFLDNGPGNHGVDVADVLKVFDETCFIQTVYKLAPVDLKESFAAQGITEDRGMDFSDPNRPLGGHFFARPDGGHECAIGFVSDEDIDSVIHKQFGDYADTRMPRPMTKTPKAFNFAKPPDEEGYQTSEPEGARKWDIRSFSDTDLQYFVIMLTNDHSIQHEVKLISIPNDVMDALK